MKSSDLGKETVHLGSKMAQESGAKQKRRTARLAQDLPRGITIGVRDDGRPKPYFVRFGQPRKTESYPTEKERNDRADELAGEKNERGDSVFRFAPAEWEEFKAWKARRTNLQTGVVVGDAVDDYLEARQSRGLAEDSVRHTKTNLKRFIEMYGALHLAEITSDHVKEWLGWLEEKFSFQSTTLRHHRKDLNVFFVWARLQKLIEENPCSSVPPPALDQTDEISVMALEDAFKFFKANAGEPAIGRLAMEAFGGLRHSSAGRISKEDLDFAEKGIVFQASKHKSGARHYVDGFPRNLWRWLSHAEDGWGLKPRNYAQHKALAFARANVKNPGNVFRHTFATCHLAAFKDAGALATLLTHRNLTMLYQHYKGRGMPNRAAKAYFMITPKTVLLSFERFCRMVKLLQK